MEIVFDNFGNPWKLKNPTGKFELFQSHDNYIVGETSCKSWYQYVGSYDSHEDLVKDMTQNFNENDRLYIFYPNGLTHDDQRPIPCNDDSLPF